MKPSQGGGIPMYNNNFNVDSENSYNPTYPYLHAQPAPRKKTGRKLLKVLGCGLLALVLWRKEKRNPATRTSEEQKKYNKNNRRCIIIFGISSICLMWLFF